MVCLAVAFGGMGTPEKWSLKRLVGKSSNSNNNSNNNHNNNHNDSSTDDNDGSYSRSAGLRHRHGKTFRTLTRKQGIASPTPRLSCRARVLHHLGSWSNPTVSWQTCRNHLHQTPLLSGDPAKRWQRHQVPPPETTVKVGSNMAKINCWAECYLNVHV